MNTYAIIYLSIIFIVSIICVYYASKLSHRMKELSNHINFGINTNTELAKMSGLKYEQGLSANGKLQAYKDIRDELKKIIG